jgi:hypothetical protein
MEIIDFPGYKKYFLFLIIVTIPLCLETGVRTDANKNQYSRFHLGVPYYQAEIRPVEPDQVMLFRKGKRTISSLPKS